MDEQALLRAQTLQRAGRYAEAIEAYQSLLDAHPDAGPELANLATCLRHTGQLEPALRAFERALALLPHATPILFNAANAYAAAKQELRAEQAFRRALEIQPNFAAAWFNLGRLLQAQARAGEAEAAYAQVLEIEPRNATAWMNRGNALRAMGRVGEAIAAHGHAIAIDATRAETWLNLGNALRDDQQLQQADAAYAKALSLRDDLHAARMALIGLLQHGGQREAAHAVLDAAIVRYPDEVDYLFERARMWITADRKRDALPLLQRAAGIAPRDARVCNALGIALEASSDRERALQAFAQAIALDAEFAIAHANYGQLARQMGRVKEGIDALRHAVALAPNDASACGNLIDGLVATGHLQEAIEHAERALTGDLIDACAIHTALGHAYNCAGRSTESAQQLECALALKSSNIHISNALFASLYADSHDSVDKAVQHQTYAARIEPAVEAFRYAPPGPRADRRLRIGYLSADFAEHPVGFFMQPILCHHDRAQLEVFAYATRNADDAVTRALRGCTEHWRDGVGRGDLELLDMVRRDELDVLVDLAGHTAHNHLSVFAARAAARQLSYLGYPFSTGLAQMDGYIADAVTVPETDATLYTEQVLKLSCFSFCMQVHPTAPEVSALPASRNGFLTFGCFNNLAKLSSSTIAAWAGILNTLADARLVLRALGLNDRVTCERVWQQFAAHGVAPSRLELLPPIRPIEAFLRGYERVDIALDPMPFNGGTTSFEALWQGVPVLTQPGRGFFARMGAGINRSAGLDTFTAVSAADLVARAVHWSQNLDELAQLRHAMRSTLQGTTLFDGDRFTRAFEQVLCS